MPAPYVELRKILLGTRRHPFRYITKIVTNDARGRALVARLCTRKAA